MGSGELGPREQSAWPGGGSQRGPLGAGGSKVPKHYSGFEGFVLLVDCCFQVPNEPSLVYAKPAPVWAQETLQQRTQHCTSTIGKLGVQ